METSFQFYKETEFKEVELNGRVVEIPEDWEVVRLDEIAKIRRGASPRPKGDPKYFGGNIPWIKISDLSKFKQGLFLLKTEDTVTEEGKKKSVYLPDGSLIVSNSGTIGEPAIISTGRGGCIHDGFIAVDPITQKVEKYYLYYYFDHTKSYLQQKAQKGTQGNLNTNIWKSLLIPLPPLEEQKKIAHVLRTMDNAIEIVDKAIEKLERIKKATMEQLLTKGIVLGFMFDTNIFDRILDGEIELPQNLKYYVTHIQYDEICKIPDRKRERREKLLKVFNKVPKEVIPTECCVVGVSRVGMAKLGSDADGELYNRMLKRLKELDEKSGKQKQIENQASDILIALTSIKNNLVLVTEDRNLKKVVEEFGGCAITFEQFIRGEYREFKDTEIGKIPKNWDVVRLGDKRIAEIRKNKIVNDVEKIAFIPMELIPDSGIYVKYELRNLEEVKSSTYCEAGDLLLAKITPCFENGKQGIVPEDIPNGFALATTEIFPIACKGIDKLFLFYLLKHHRFRKILEFSMRGTTGRKRVPKGAVENLQIPLPPLEEQKQIAKILKTIDEAIELKKKKKERLERMKKAVMDKLLTGKVRIK